MTLGIVMVIAGSGMQVLAWSAYRRAYPKFWVSRPIWYFLYPKGCVLCVAGIWLVLAGVMVMAANP